MMEARGQRLWAIESMYGPFTFSTSMLNETQCGKRACNVNLKSRSSQKKILKKENKEGNTRVLVVVYLFLPRSCIIMKLDMHILYGNYFRAIDLFFTGVFQSCEKHGDGQHPGFPGYTPDYNPFVDALYCDQKPFVTTQKNVTNSTTKQAKVI